MLAVGTVVVSSPVEVAATAAVIVPDPGSAPLYAADPSSPETLLRFPASGGAAETVPVPGVEDPTAVAISPAGDVYVADDDGQTDHVVAFRADNSTAVVASGLEDIFGLAVASNGDLLIATGDGVVRADSAGALTPVGAGLSQPGGVAVDRFGTVLIADTGNNRVVAVTEEGVQSVVELPPLSAPEGVAVDLSGDIYVADTGNARVLALPAAGGAASEIGDGFVQPLKVAVDEQGRAFVADLERGLLLVPADGGGTTVIDTGGAFPYDAQMPAFPAPLIDLAGTAGNGDTRVVYGPPDATPGSTYTITAQNITNPAAPELAAQSTDGTAVVVGGLTNGDNYTFSGTVTNPAGATSVNSPASAPVTPSADLSSAPAAAAATPTHTEWFGPFVKDLHDPTLTYSQEYDCATNVATPGGVALYPYVVPSGYDSVTYRSTSSSGVKVDINPVKTDFQDPGKFWLYVTSLHVSGDYALRIAYQCQADNPMDPFTTQSTNVTAFGTTTALVTGTWLSQGDPEVKMVYRVEYGTTYGVYPNQTPWLTAPLPSNGTAFKLTTELTGLAPNTTYHYRVASAATESAGRSGGPSYSGPDATFTTASASPADGEPAPSDSGSPAPQPPVDGGAASPGARQLATSGGTVPAVLLVVAAGLLGVGIAAVYASRNRRTHASR